MAVIFTRGTDESVLFPPPFTSNLELIHISVSETDMSDLTKEIAGPLLSFQGKTGDSPVKKQAKCGLQT